MLINIELGIKKSISELQWLIVAKILMWSGETGDLSSDSFHWIHIWKELKLTSLIDDLLSVNTTSERNCHTIMTRTLNERSVAGETRWWCSRAPFGKMVLMGAIMLKHDADFKWRGYEFWKIRRKMSNA